MKGECFTYSINKKIDLSKLSKIKYLQYDECRQIMTAKINELVITVQPDGKIRVFIPEKTYEEIKEKLLTASMEIYGIIDEVNKTLRLGVNAKQVISTGERETVGEYDPSLRKQLGDEVSLDTVRHLIYATYDIAGDFQAERIMTQAGETIARQIIAEKQPHSKTELIKIITDYFKQAKIGIVEEKTIKKSSITQETVLSVREHAFAVGIPNVNRKICHFTRGFIRGAFAEFKRMESLTVNETKCWGKGDTCCEFEVYSMAR